MRWHDQRISAEQFHHERFGLNVSHGISEKAIAMLQRTLPRDQPPAGNGDGGST